MEDKKKLERRRFKAKDENGNPLWEITANSIVSQPAIEKDFQLFSMVPGLVHFFTSIAQANRTRFQVTNNEKMEITGPVMVPNQDILRFDEVTKEYYYCYFTEEDVEAFAEMFIQEANHNQANFEHQENFTDKVKLKELWIVTDPKNDKSNALGFKEIVKGTFFMTYKVYDAVLWEKIKESSLKGFSVEINTTDNYEDEINDIIEDLDLSKQEKRKALFEIVNYHSFINVGELSFCDYPEAAVMNAKKALEYLSMNPENQCGNKLMWTRCKQIANKQPLSYSNLKRISLFIKGESKANAARPDYACPAVMWDALGGTDLIYWSVQKLQQIDELVKKETEAKNPKKTWPFRN